jgi:hypothetical protein
MGSRWSSTPEERRPWLQATLIAVALLALPLVVLVLVPRPEPPPREAAPLGAVPVETGAAPTARAAATVQRATAGPTLASAAAPPAPEGFVGGRVVDPSDQPIAGARVGCEDDASGAGATSGADGAFELAASASCRAVATHAGFAPSEPARLTPGTPLTLRLRAAGAIAGQVVDEQGSPVAEVAIAIESFVSDEPTSVPAGLSRAQPSSDPAGAFRLEGLLGGRYVLTAHVADRPPASSAQVHVRAGGTTEGVRIVVGAGATLTGRVLGADTRAPLEGASVSLDGATWTEGAAAPTATTARDGTFALRGVPPGPFSIRVAHPDYRARVVAGLSAASAGAPRDVELERADAGADETEITGIGAFVSQGQKGVLVLGLLPDGPAQRAGLRIGDRIERIDGAATEGLSPAQCTQLLRGAAGSTVALALVRTDGSTPTISVRREAFLWPSARGMPVGRVAAAALGCARSGRS